MDKLGNYYKHLVQRYTDNTDDEINEEFLEIMLERKTKIKELEFWDKINEY